MRLTDYLEAKGITDTEFARLVGVSHSLVHYWKSGAKRPSMETAARIRDATGGAVTADDFMPPPRASARAAAADTS